MWIKFTLVTIKIDFWCLAVTVKDVFEREHIFVSKMLKSAAWGSHPCDRWIGECEMFTPKLLTWVRTFRLQNTLEEYSMSVWGILSVPVWVLIQVWSTTQPKSSPGTGPGLCLGQHKHKFIVPGHNNKNSLPKQRGVLQWNLNSCWLLNSVLELLKVSGAEVAFFFNEN